MYNQIYLKYFHGIGFSNWIIWCPGLSVTDVSCHQCSCSICYLTCHLKSTSVHLLHFVFTASNSHFRPMGIVLNTTRIFHFLLVAYLLYDLHATFVKDYITFSATCMTYFALKYISYMMCIWPQKVNKTYEHTKKKKLKFSHQGQTSDVCDSPMAKR